jgi:hypothetical protein
LISFVFENTLLRAACPTRVFVAQRLDHSAVMGIDTSAKQDYREVQELKDEVVGNER